MSTTEGKTENSDLVQKIASLMGFCPQFFLLARETPDVLDDLWGRTEKAYLQNPLPNDFKDRLFAYLSRFCEDEYCVARHAAILVGTSMDVASVIEMLSMPMPDTELIRQRLEELSAIDEPIDDWPEANSRLEENVFLCSIPLFLRTGVSRECHIGLKRALGTNWYNRLVQFLSFIHASHFWIESHPWIQHDQPTKLFIEQESEFAEWLIANPGQVANELKAVKGDGIGNIQMAHAKMLRNQAKIREQLSIKTKQQEREKALFQGIVNGVPDALMLADLERNITYCNPGVKRVFGYEPDELVGQPTSVLYFDPEDHTKQGLVRFNESADEDVKTFQVRWKRKNGEPFVGESVGSIIKDLNANPIGFIGLIRDTTERNRIETEQQRRSRVMDSISRGDSLHQVLSLVVAEAEKARPGMIGSILLLDSETGLMQTGCGDGLPDFYNQSINGLLPGHGVGSCGTAIASGRTVVVDDIQNHPYWSDFVDLAKRADLQACWSEPIKGVNDQVIGSLAMYFRQPQTPSENDLKVLSDCAQLAGIAIQRAEALELLRKSEQRFELAVRGSADGIWDVPKLTEKKLWLSPRVFELLGFESAELESDVEALAEMLHADDYPHTVAAVDALFQKDVPFDVEQRIRCKDGVYRWFRVRAYALKDEEGIPIRITGSLEDIHDRVVAQNQAISLGHLLEESLNEIYVFDAETQILCYANQVARKNLGYSKSELLTMKPDDFTIGDSITSLTNGIANLKAGQDSSIRLEYRHLRNDSSSYDVEAYIQSTMYLGRESIVAFVLDITERKVAEAQRKTLERYVLNAATEEQRRIGTDLHDGVGQELTGLVMLADSLTMALKQQSLPESELAEKIGILTEKSLDQVRSLSRGLNPVEVDPQGLNFALTELTAHAEDLYDVECEFLGNHDAEPNDSEVATQLYRITQEAITNSVKHGKATFISVQLQTNDSSVLLTIADNGCGFDVQNEHDGIGLRSMGYRANLIGAELNVKPNKNNGTIVTCSLPV